MDGTLCNVSTVIHLQTEPDGFAAFCEACARCPPNEVTTVLEWGEGRVWLHTPKA